jgi:uncharacterized membrane protein
VINKPVSEVFGMWSEAERYPEWLDLSIEQRKITEGPMAVGSRYQAVDKMPLGRRIDFTLEIMACEPDKYISATLSAPNNANWEATFEEMSEGTRMTFKMVAHFSGLQALIAPLFKGWATRQMQDGLNNFKAAAELS